MTCKLVGLRTTLIALWILTPIVWCQEQIPINNFSLLLQQIAKNYKMNIQWEKLTFPVKTTHGLITGKQAENQDLQSYSPIFIEEFSLYPTQLIRRAQLKQVVLCTDLAFAGQRRNAIPDYEHDTLYLDVRRGSYNRNYLRNVIHHEFFHIIDYRDDGLVYQDERWLKLNRADYKYGSGGMNAQNKQDTSVLTNQYPGFLNHYSTTGVEEDKAEIFAQMMVNLKYVEKRAETDVILKAKRNRMQELMASFCPEMNSQFWDKIRQRK